MSLKSTNFVIQLFLLGGLCLTGILICLALWVFRYDFRNDKETLRARELDNCLRATCKSLDQRAIVTAFGPANEILDGTTILDPRIPTERSCSNSAPVKAIFCYDGRLPEDGLFGTEWWSYTYYFAFDAHGTLCWIARSLD